MNMKSIWRVSTGGRSLGMFLIPPTRNEPSSTYYLKPLILNSGGRGLIVPSGGGLPTTFGTCASREITALMETTPSRIRRASLAKAVAIQIRTYSKSGSSHSTMTGRRRQFSGGVRSSSSGISTVGTLKIRISPPKNWRRRRNPHSKTLRTDVLARPLPPLPNRLQARGADAAVTADDRHIEINRSGRHDAVRHAAHATKREGFRGVFCISPLT